MTNPVEHRITTIKELGDIITLENAEEMIQNLTEWVTLVATVKTQVDIDISVLTEAVTEAVIWVEDEVPGVTGVNIAIEPR